MLEVFGLSHAYGRHQALDEVSIRLRAGEAVAILGANGAGKTTLINAIAGLLRPASGSIRFEGHELVGLSPHRIVEMGIATVPENRRLFEPMSVMENLNLGDAGTHIRTFSPPRRTAPPGRAYHERGRAADGGNWPSADDTAQTASAR